MQVESQSESGVTKTQVISSDWYRSLSKYEKSHHGKAVWQLINSFLPYFGLWAMIVFMAKEGVSFWFRLPLMVLAAGLLVRVFIIFHDCCHGSFFRSRRANHILGYLAGLLVFTPFEDWRHTHAGHHAAAGDLERRGVGDIWTMTVEEFRSAPKRTQIVYRIFRHPFVLFVLGPPVVFFGIHRFPHRVTGARGRKSVMYTNLGLAVMIAMACLTMGWKTYLLIQLPISSIASAVGVWMFYVQHQFEPVYWDHHQGWDPIRAALEGSSYYKLPKVLQWFTGNIGLHHIHHLRPGIANYNLQKAFDEVPALQAVEPLTIRESIKSIWMHLWDEAEKKMVSFRWVKRHYRLAPRSTQS